jgi:CubicO group peptidase (beta-lactamase class C family)
MGLPTASPNDLGLDSRRLAVADAHVQEGVENKTYPGAVLLVARHGKIGHQKAFGHLQPGGGATRVDSIFDLASLTKPVNAVALLTLIEDGKVSLPQRLEELLPETRGSALATVTVRQLATHTSGLPAWKPLYKIPGGKKPMLADILQTPLHHPPGTRYIYSDLGYLLIGEMIERVSGMSLDQYVHARVLAPMGMRDTGYLPAATRKNRIAATANCPLRPGRTLVGEVHDSNAYAFGGVAGHAGLFGTAPDLALLGSALARRGEAGGRRLLGLPTLQLAQTSQIPPEIGGHSIGWFTPPNGMLPRGDLLGVRAFGHTGFTGTMLVCDPEYALVIALLTNRVMNPSENDGILRIRRQVVHAVASAIVD